MNVKELREYCLAFNGAEEKMPFDEKTLVFTVKDKMFCLADSESFEFITVKCNPQRAVELRRKYGEVFPGYYMNKKHWNSVKTDGRITDSQMKEWIGDSYELVVAGLPKKVQKELKEQG